MHTKSFTGERAEGLEVKAGHVALGISNAQRGGRSEAVHRKACSLLPGAVGPPELEQVVGGQRRDPPQHHRARRCVERRYATTTLYFLIILSNHFFPI